MMKHIYILSCEKNGGVYHYIFNNGEFQFAEKTPLDRPMYAIIRDNRMYVILRETDTQTHFGGIVSYELNENGNLTNPTETESTNGIVPCHLEIIGNDKFVVNYLPGNIVKLGKKTVTHSGKGVHPTRQDAPHTHFVCASPDKKYLLCTDLGLDKVFIYTKDLDKISEIKLTDSCGPRHLVFSENGDYIFVACELSSTVELLKYSNGNMTHTGSFSCLPNDFNKENTVAAIRRKGNNIYVSNRGHDSISIFDFNKGALKLKQNVKCGGKSPRDINIIGDYLLSSNELSNNATVFRIGADSSLCKLDTEFKIPSPVCILSD